MPQVVRGYQRLLEAALQESAIQSATLLPYCGTCGTLFERHTFVAPNIQNKNCLHSPPSPPPLLYTSDVICQLIYIMLFRKKPQIQQFLSIGSIFERPIFWSLATNLGTPFKAPTKLDTLKGEDTIIGC